MKWETEFRKNSSCTLRSLCPDTTTPPLGHCLYLVSWVQFVSESTVSLPLQRLVSIYFVWLVLSHLTAVQYNSSWSSEQKLCSAVLSTAAVAVITHTTGSKQLMLHCAPIRDDRKFKRTIPNDKLKWLLLTPLIYRGACFLTLLPLWSLSPALSAVVTHWLAYQLESLCYETGTGTFIPSVTKGLLTQSSWTHCTACVREICLVCLADQAL